MDEDLVRSKMSQILDMLQGDISSVRTGRATPAIVEDLSVLVYGGQQKLKVQELATIALSDRQTIVIDPWDKSIIGEIRKGIESANIGLTPIIAGDVIRINIPLFTTEDREKFTKLLGVKIESARIMIRQVRGDVMHDIKKSFEAKEITEDEKFGNEKKLQGITDEFIGKIEELGEKKRQELLQI